MGNTSKSLADELTRGFRWVLAACAVMAVGILYVEWRFDDRLRYRAPNVLEMSEQDAASGDVVLVSRERHAVYVPAYSHVYHQDGRPLPLTVTLSVRNTDRDHEIVLTSVRYYDSRGQGVRSHLDRPIHLKPLSTVEFLVERDDTSGGSGASFIIEWAADQSVTTPLIETVMIDTEHRQGISFVRRGVVAATAQSEE